MKFTFEPIGVLSSCFTEKFAIPRQAGLVPAATAVLELLPPYDVQEALRGLERFSHIWLVFVFHKNISTPWRPTVRPPRLGGNRRVGVFSSRSPFRPNPIGMSSARLERIELESGPPRLYLSGVDILDGTPILDIKPYVPYADRCDDAVGGFAAEAPEAAFRVRFTPQAMAACVAAEAKGALNLQRIIQQALSQDTRPAYYSGRDGKDLFGTRFYGLEVKWRITDDEVLVLSVTPGGP